MFQLVLDRRYLPSLEELHELAGSSHHPKLAGQVNSRWQEYQRQKPNSFEAAMAFHGAVPSFSVPIVEIEQHELPNPRLSAEDRALMNKSKMELYELGAIVPVTPAMLKKGKIIFHHPFLVGKKQTTEKRLCCNSKPGINRYGVSQHYRQNGLRQAKVSLQVGDWLVTIDLEKAYHLLALALWMQRLCGMTEKDVELMKIAPLGWVWVVLMFGLWDSPRLFIVMLKVALSEIRSLGVRLSDLVDDMLVQEESYDGCVRALFISLFILRRFGWRVSLKKLCAIPSQLVEFGGVEVNSATWTLTVPAWKRSKHLLVYCRLLKACRRAMHPNNNANSHTRKAIVPLEMWWSALGMFFSVMDAVPGVKTHGSHMNWVMRRAQQLGLSPSADVTPLLLTEQGGKAVKELQIIVDPDFWECWNGKVIRKRAPTHHLWGDASGAGHGGQLYCHGRTLQTFSQFHVPELQGQHSAMTETLGMCKMIRQAIRSANLWQAHIVYHTDNTPAMWAMLKEGSRQSNRAKEFRAMLTDLRNSESVATAVHEAGDLMVETGIDALSRPKRPNTLREAKLAPAVVQVLEQVYGKFTIDLMATESNTQHPTFISLDRHQLQASWYDVMALNWTVLQHEVPYVFPPFNLVQQVMNKVKEAAPLSVIVVVPYWPSQQWWPSLVAMLASLPILIPVNELTLQHPLGLGKALGALNTTHSWSTRGWHLIGAIISSDRSLREDWRCQLLSSYQAGLEPAMIDGMTQAGTAGCMPEARLPVVAGELLELLISSISRLG